MLLIIRRLKSVLLIWLAAAALSPAAAETILFVGNSFTFGAGSAVMRYRPDKVTDLNGGGIGGVPALFKTFAEQAGLDWTVSLETAPGADLAFHFANKRALIERSWDVVLLQGHSMLDLRKPGDPANHIAAAHKLADMFHKANPNVRVDLVSTWSRADQTYKEDGHWAGQAITAMADDIEMGNRQALAGNENIDGIITVGRAWSRAIRDRIADANPYDGIDFGKINLWTWDQYHASAEGYYLEAIMIFGSVTGYDPRRLPIREIAATDLGIETRVAARLRAIAAAELGFPAMASAPSATVPPLGAPNDQ